eukprot:TRINITY_DN14162_c0_g1_i3.p2 TRINITY_DN14162_c0_g1~~TRINITY_DN14162_c0_g1_i3.p2  ORF type:complete len:139 (-),score=12.66 TRINITY_DN14162_c0_g1_i3:520-936(-)
MSAYTSFIHDNTIEDQIPTSSLIHSKLHLKRQIKIGSKVPSSPAHKEVSSSSILSSHGHDFSYEKHLSKNTALSRRPRIPIKVGGNDLSLSSFPLSGMHSPANTSFGKKNESVCLNLPTAKAIIYNSTVQFFTTAQVS